MKECAVRTYDRSFRESGEDVVKLASALVVLTARASAPRT